MKKFEYRLFPNKEQQHLLMQCLVRTHICTSCGHTADRDVNAAKNILTAGQHFTRQHKPAGYA